jgi:pimeloyl-ACP methyl ester carboxylesterase
MNFLTRVADRLILQPTTHYIDPEELVRRVIVTRSGEVEVWIASEISDLPDATKVLLLKFPGTGGRAERSGPHPAEAWPDISCESWTINHRGYGGSPGPATVQNFAETCDSVLSEIVESFPDHKLVVYGNSLGCLSALYVSARFPVAAAYIRNPPPLAQMITTRPRYAWWSLGMSKLIADQVPDSLDAIENARRSTCPALIVQSELDRVIPPKYQDLVISQFGGKVRKLVLRGADHHHRAGESQFEEYDEAVRWLGKQILNSN